MLAILCGDSFLCWYYFLAGGQIHPLVLLAFAAEQIPDASSLTGPDFFLQGFGLRPTGWEFYASPFYPSSRITDPKCYRTSPQTTPIIGTT